LVFWQDQVLDRPADRSTSLIAVLIRKGVKEATMNSNQTLFDIHANSLLAATYSDPSEVLADPVLSSLEKRCVLAAWASDAFAVEDSPWLRQLPGSPSAIWVGHILSALRELDEEDDPPPLSGAPAQRLPLLEEPKLAVGF
jgi:hypothetical protein